MDRVLAIIMAGGVGERLIPLTEDRSKAAVPFGGKFRLIDFTLSNCINSGLRQVFVLTQYRSTSLNRHIQEAWGISSARLGDYIYTIPAQQKRGMDWYSGTADAIRQNLDLCRKRDIDHVLILSGDHVYKMNYFQIASYHRAKNADLTIAAIKVKKEYAAGQLGVLETDQDYRMVGFEEKPAQPKTAPDSPGHALASMGVYIFRIAILRKLLEGPGDDFGKDIIPRALTEGFNISVYDYEAENRIADFVTKVENGQRIKVLVDRTRDSSYWKDVGTIDSYYDASMDLISVDPIFNLYGERWPFRTYQRPLPPSKFVIGGSAQDSVVCDGCVISGGTVRGSILSPGVIVESNAAVEESIVFDDVTIEPNARIRRAIIDKEANVRAGTSLGYDHEADKKRGCTISPEGIVVVPKGLKIEPL